LAVGETANLVASYSVTDEHGSTAVSSLIITVTGAVNTVVGDTGDNVIIGQDDENDLKGLDGNDTLVGGAAKDVLDGGAGDDLLEGGGGADTLIGGTGFDTATYESAPNRVEINLATGAVAASAAGDTFSGIEGIIGTMFGDIITGNAGDNVIDGLAGNDVLAGFKGDDVINGGDGNDFITGGSGADTIDGGAGTSDMARYVGSDAGVSVDLGAGTASGGHAAGDMLSNIEFLFGSSFSDSLTGDANNNWLYGAGGDDMLSGGAGIDKLFGGAGADTFVFAAGEQFTFVTDFQNDIDSIDLTAYGYADVSDALANMNQLGNHVRFFDGGDTLLVLNVDLSDIADDIII